MQRTRHVCLSLIPGLFALITGSFLVWSARWLTFGVPTTGIHFGDLKVILFAAECAQHDPGWSINSVPCLPEMAIYNYPSLWAKFFGLVGLDASAASAITVIFICLFAIALSTLAYFSIRQDNKWFPLVAISAAGVSPPALLAFERGNIDLLIFAMTVTSVTLYLARWGRWSAVALGIATFLKIFPVGGALMLASEARRRTSTLLVFVATTAVGLILIARDLPAMYTRTPALDGASFGSAVLPLLALNRAGLQGHVALAKVVGLIGFALVFGVMFFVARRSSRESALSDLRLDVSSDRIASSLVLAGAGSFTVAYLIGPSFDYRLITLIPVIAGLARIGTRVSRITAIIVLVQMLLSYSTFIGPVEYLSDLMLLLLAPALAIFCLQLLRSTTHEAGDAPRQRRERN